jgi:uncharacterized OB-fold protein
MTEYTRFDLRERERTRLKCTKCGAMYIGRERQLYCQPCGKEVQKEKIREHHLRKLAKRAERDELYGRV